MASRNPSYSEHLNTLVALTTHLGLTDYKSRTPANIAAAISLDAAEVRAVLDAFPGIFRRSKNVSTSSEPYYTLQARYARRPQKLASGDAEDMDNAPLEVTYLTSFLEFISQRALQEEHLRSQRKQAWIAAVSALIAAVAAVIAAWLAARC